MSDPGLRPYVELIDEMATVDLIARLDVPPVRLWSSSDPSGGNEDYNHFVGEGPEGWNVLADLEGPGYISRFWFTGARNHHRLQFLFDHEEHPRIDTTLGEFCGGAEPFLSPLAAYEQNCWYNLTPIPYASRLVILSQVGEDPREGWPRHFYQISEVRLPPDRAVESYPRELDEGTVQRLRELREGWGRAAGSQSLSEARTVHGAVVVPGGQEAWFDEVPGPAVIRALRLTPDFSEAPSAVAIDDWLREVRLLVRYDDPQAEPSIDVPIGDFFGSIPRPTRYQSAYVGMAGDTFESRLPMPFAGACRVGLRNDGVNELGVRFEADVTDAPADGEWGYLHAVWQSTGPGQVGRPHPVIQAEGRGRVAGCMLTVTSADESWWVLESDETIRIDRAPTPQWYGTGLEDYFTGGWYYGNALARPFHGLLFKAPYRTVQYRFHPHEAIRFEEAVDMRFERGPDHASRAWLESVGYYYLAQPTAVTEPLSPAAARRSAPDRMLATTVMTELLNLERLGDYRGAAHAVDTVLERMHGLPELEALRLRQLAYRESLEGIDAVRPDYEAFIAATTSTVARAQAQDLLWFHESPEHALLGAYCSMPTRVFLDGRPLFQFGDRQRLYVHRLTIQPGRHVLALQGEAQAYPDWVQLYLRTHAGDVTTTTEWRFSTSPEGRWQDLGYDDSGWEDVGGSAVKGPPETPFLYVTPNAYVGMQSLAAGLRPVGDTRKDQGIFAFRREFDLPE